MLFGLNLTEYVYVMFIFCPLGRALDGISIGSLLAQSGWSGFLWLIDDGTTFTEMIRPPFCLNATPHSSVAPLW